MKKLALITLVASMAALTACSKPTTEVKQGESTATTAQAEAPKPVALSTDNVADIQSDIDKLQSYGAAQEQKSQELGQKMQAAVEKKDKAEVDKLFKDLKAFVEKSNSELKAFDLKSSEVNELREKMIENSLISIEMSEMVIQGDPEKIDVEKVKPLQEKAMKAQQELIALSEQIHQKLNAGAQPADAAAATTAPAEQAAPAANDTAPAAAAQ